jgi:hypothetical protein
LQEKYFKTELARKWMDWTRYKRYYSTSVLWWTRFVKTKIKRVFTLEGARRKPAEVSIDQLAIQDLLDGVNLHLDVAAHIGLQQPRTEAELHMAVWRGKRNKAPGYDAVPTDFLQLLWPIIKDDLLQAINKMYLGGALPGMQTRGVVVCVPKTPRPMSPEDYYS